jgi:LPPG:FO 2-phospho-L-lactate transferase
VIWPAKNKVLALCGGVGGAKLALGLSRVLSPDQLTVLVNTGDDFEHLGLPICPDLDTVTYTLAGLSNAELGWGREDESWNCLEILEQLGAAAWFRLGDRDLALHIARRELLGAGMSLSEAIAAISRSLGVKHHIVPMSDQPVRTKVETEEGGLSFQHYFVREKCRPAVKGFNFDGADESKPSPGFINALNDPDLSAILVCPSNPFVSVAPILAIPGVVESLARHPAPLIAVSPIVACQAIKGPTAKMMTELGLEISALGVFRHYGSLLDGFVLDQQDRELLHAFPEPDRVLCCNTLMQSLDDRTELARQCLDFAQRLAGPRLDKE